MHLLYLRRDEQVQGLVKSKRANREVIYSVHCKMNLRRVKWREKEGVLLPKGRTQTFVKAERVCIIRDEKKIHLQYLQHAQDTVQVTNSASVTHLKVESL